MVQSSPSIRMVRPGRKSDVDGIGEERDGVKNGNNDGKAREKIRISPVKVKNPTCAD